METVDKGLKYTFLVQCEGFELGECENNVVTLREHLIRFCLTGYCNHIFFTSSLGMLRYYDPDMIIFAEKWLQLSKIHICAENVVSIENYPHFFVKPHFSSLSMFL